MNTDWLNENLKLEIKKVFEPRYGKKLNNQDVCEVALNLVNYVEAKTKFILNKKYETSI